MTTRNTPAAVVLVLAIGMPVGAQTPAPPVLISNSDTLSAIPTNASTSAGLAVSADERFVAFNSSATNLVVGDTNDVADVFVRDRVANITERVSVADDGSQANAQSVGSVGMTADGRFVVFASDASNLVPGDTNGVRDIFMRDRTLGTTTRLSIVPGSGVQANGSSLNPTITPDGNFVAFATNATNLLSGDTNARTDVVRRDIQGLFLSANQVGTTQGNGNADAPSISIGGDFVVFHSLSSNLVAGDSNGVRDVFRHNFNNRSVVRASVTQDGSQLAAESITFSGLSVSAEGNRVLFTTAAAAEM
ncbi:MAG: calcium-binding protein, partial [Gammaproteobacteria bacterium]|nr:calcium-binding protein [Gammaproteobacteria bacterium]